MGNNEAFTSFEASVLAVYNHGALTKPLLMALMAPYSGMDIDSGGMEGTLSHDGLDVVDIVLKTNEVPLPVRPDLPKNYRKWTNAQSDANDKWQEARWEAFHAITSEAGWE